MTETVESFEFISRAGKETAVGHLVENTRHAMGRHPSPSDNDVYNEHNFGAFQHEGQRLFWKIDYYDKQLEYGSPDPSDPSVTARIITIMLASEY